MEDRLMGAGLFAIIHRIEKVTGRHFFLIKPYDWDSKGRIHYKYGVGEYVSGNEFVLLKPTLMKNAKAFLLKMEGDVKTV